MTNNFFKSYQFAKKCLTLTEVADQGMQNQIGHSLNFGCRFSVLEGEACDMYFIYLILMKTFFKISCTIFFRFFSISVNLCKVQVKYHCFH